MYVQNLKIFTSLTTGGREIKANLALSERVCEITGWVVEPTQFMSQSWQRPCKTDWRTHCEVCFTLNCSLASLPLMALVIISLQVWSQIVIPPAFLFLLYNLLCITDLLPLLVACL